MLAQKWWRDLVITLTSPAEYLHFLNGSFMSSIWFFVASYLLIGSLVGLKLGLSDFPNLKSQSLEALAELETRYPENLSITWQNQEISLDPAETLTVEYPSVWKAAAVQGGYPKNLLTFIPSLDQPDEETIKNALPTSSFVVITKKQLMINLPGGGWNRAELSELFTTSEIITLNKSTLPSMIQRARYQLDQLSRVLPILLMGTWPLILIILRLWSSILDSLFIWLITQMFGKRFGYLKVLQLTLHISVAAEIVHQLSSAFLPNLPFPVFGVTFWLLWTALLVVLKDVRAVSLNSSKS